MLEVLSLCPVLRTFGRKSFHTYASPKTVKEMHIKVPQNSQKPFVSTSRMNVKVQESLYNKLSNLGVR
jgi:hypothetical protein